jgi:hypothetical protein
MIYDRVDWHYKGDYPSDLPPQYGGTHIVISFAWLVNQQLESEQLSIAHSAELDAIRARTLSGREFLARLRDGELTDGDINDTGNAFTQSYYDSDIYFQDYAEVLVGELPSLYHVDDSWENYDIMAQRINERFAAWNQNRRPWWRFW